MVTQVEKISPDNGEDTGPNGDNHSGATKLGVSETGLKGLPAPGVYFDGVDSYEISNSQRGHWYAMKVEPDGSLTYIAQNVDLDMLTSERQSSGCWGCDNLGKDGCAAHSDHIRKLRTMTAAEIASIQPFLLLSHPCGTDANDSHRSN